MLAFFSFFVSVSCLVGAVSACLSSGAAGIAPEQQTQFTKPTAARSVGEVIHETFQVVDMMELRSLADRELSRLEKDARVCRAVYPRWLFLRANSYKMSGRQALGNAGFAQVGSRCPIFLFVRILVLC